MKEIIRISITTALIILAAKLLRIAQKIRPDLVDFFFEKIVKKVEDDVRASLNVREEDENPFHPCPDCDHDHRLHTCACGCKNRLY